MSLLSFNKHLISTQENSTLAALSDQQNVTNSSRTWLTIGYHLTPFSYRKMIKLLRIYESLHRHSSCRHLENTASVQQELFIEPKGFEPKEERIQVRVKKSTKTFPYKKKKSVLICSD